MQKLWVLALGLLSTAPLVGTNALAEPPAQTVYDRVVAAVVAEFGFLPETATVNGVEVPAEAALALLRENPGPLGAQDNLYTWDHDVGFGTRTGGFECIVAAVITAVSITSGLHDPIINRETIGEPDPTDPGFPPFDPPSTIFCGVFIPYVIGEVGGEISGFDFFWVACVNPGPFGLVGLWINEPDDCHENDFAAGNIVGRVGHHLIHFCFFGICINTGQMFGGVRSTLPLELDTAVIGLQD